MEKHSGRHRRRRQGWGEQVRWLLGAVLAALLCGPTDRSTRPAAEDRRPMPSRSARPGCEPISARTAAKERGHVPRPRSEKQPSATPVGVSAQRARALYTGPRGWCEDDDGVRGVRPYLARHEDRVVRTRTRGGLRANWCGETIGGRGLVASRPSNSGGGGGEFAELACLVRRWKAIST